MERNNKNHETKALNLNDHFVANFSSGKEIKSMNRSKSIRIFDVLFSMIGLIMLLPLISIIGTICFLETGRFLFRQERVGKYGRTFIFIKFPSMKRNTPSVATHMINPSYLTKSGRKLRKLKLDELPQLFNVLKGQMSLVGPRPCLPNQKDLIEIRKKRNILNHLPGITGLAQINNIDMSDPYLLAKYDEQLVKELNIRNYFLYIMLTLMGQGHGDRIRDKN